MMDKDKKYVVGVFFGAVALIIIMLITTIIDIIKIASVNNDSEVNTENIVQVEDDIEDDSSED